MSKRGSMRVLATLCFLDIGMAKVQLQVEALTVEKHEPSATKFVVNSPNIASLA